MILGIQRGHDAGICLIENGHILLVIEAERVHRIKHATGAATIPACVDLALRELNRPSADIKAIVLADSDHDDVEHYCVPAVCEEMHAPNGMAHIGFYAQLPHLISGDIGIIGIERNTPVYTVCHHAAHAAGSLYMSGFEETALYIFDGYGICAGTLGYTYKNGALARIEDSRDKALYGWRYQLLGNFIRDINKDTTHITDYAGKLMGLCGYGKPDEHAKSLLKIWLREDFDAYKTIWDRNKVWFKGILNNTGFTWNSHSAQDEEFTTLLSSLQHAFNEVLREDAQDLLKKTKMRNLAVAGGCALNILGNDTLQAMPQIDDLFIPPNAGDSGLAMGAAVMADAILNNTPVHAPHIPLAEKRSPYKGPRIIPYPYSSLPEGVDIVSNEKGRSDALVADIVTSGGLVAYVSGALEIGPRALGHRSILADATNPDMRDLINQKIKVREWWRPFAPVSRVDFASEYFDVKYPCPYMIRSATVKPAYKEKLHSITHIDGTARLQVLPDRDAHPDLWDLLAIVKERLGMGVLLNTSLNVGGMPILNSYEEAFDFLTSTQVDALYINGILYKRTQ